MDWEALGALGEMLGAIGVLITLVYLAIQVRHNAAETHNSTIESVMSADANLRATLVNGPVPSVMAKVMAGTELIHEERLVLTYFLQAYMQGWEVAFYQNTRGSLPDDVLESIAFRRMATLFTTEKVVSWQSFSAGYTPAFQAHVKLKIEEFDSKPKPWEVDPRSAS